MSNPVYVPCNSCEERLVLNEHWYFCPTHYNHLEYPRTRKGKVDLEQLAIAQDLLDEMKNNMKGQDE